MVVELAGVTQHQQMLVLVLLTDAAAAGKTCEIVCEERMVIGVFSRDFGM